MNELPECTVVAIKRCVLQEISSSKDVQIMADELGMQKT